MANADFWADKFAENVVRDAKARAALIGLGWLPLTVWEHEIRPDPEPRARALAAEITLMRSEMAARRNQPAETQQGKQLGSSSA